MDSTSDDIDRISKAKGVRKPKKSKVTRIINQVRQYMDKGINIPSIKTLRTELKDAIENMEVANEVLFVLEPENIEHEQWIEKALEPTVSCLYDIEKYIEQCKQAHSPKSSRSSRTKSSLTSTTSVYSTSEATVSVADGQSNKIHKAKSTESSHSRLSASYKEKLVEAKLLEHDIEVISKRNKEDERLMQKQEEKEKQMREASFELRKLNEESMRARKLRTLEENKQRAMFEAELLKVMDQRSPVSTTSQNLLSSITPSTHQVNHQSKTNIHIPVSTSSTSLLSNVEPEILNGMLLKEKDKLPPASTHQEILLSTMMENTVPNSHLNSQGMDSLAPEPSHEKILSSKDSLTTTDAFAKGTYTTGVQVQSTGTTTNGSHIPSIMFAQNSSTPWVTSSHSAVNFTPLPVSSCSHANMLGQDTAKGIQGMTTPSFMPPSTQTNSPWRGQWNRPEQIFSSTLNSNKTTP